MGAAELASLASLSVRARVVVEGAYAGLHHNRHAGSSVEFAEHKEYAPGDDIRHIDWKAVARVDRYYIKRFEDETEMRTFLVLDTSASMGYKRRGVSKLEYAGILCAALAMLLAQQGDPAGLLLFDEEVRHFLPPRTRPGHVRDLMRLLEGSFAAGRTRPERALGRIGELAERRSLVLIFSDLLDAPADLGAQLRQLRARGHDVALFHVLDPDEIELPFDELCHFEGMEPDDTRQLLADPRELRAAFRKQSQAFRDGWRAGVHRGARRVSRRHDRRTARAGAARVSVRPPAGAPGGVGRAMHFLAPSLLLGLLAAGLPWLLHRLGRRRANPVRFAAMQLLLRAERQVSARRRLRDLLLLGVRTAAAAALPLLFARPYAEVPSDLPAAAQAPQTAVIVLDDSASMRRKLGGLAAATAFEEARQRARALVASMSPETDVALVLGSEGAPTPVAEPSTDRSRLRLGAGRDLRLGATRGSWGRR